MPYMKLKHFDIMHAESFWAHAALVWDMQTLRKSFFLCLFVVIGTISCTFMFRVMFAYFNICCVTKQYDHFTSIFYSF